ncbi:uncharacterized protein BKCO1_25000127 [Diplodia corticola]|uniref:Uncharacterized protein n=1 Tax=Diplodia corticola TaxID=236234 RepID=A0A1J9S393_9PEZI|nr:uncharacterized protein BKCO1_25000127 [Diplodia corticola]OJD34101.1 hypothetical protein BKCO1_25000127 [Diplodia corticola]
MSRARYAIVLTDNGEMHMDGAEGTSLKGDGIWRYSTVQSMRGFLGVLCYDGVCFLETKTDFTEKKLTRKSQVWLSSKKIGYKGGGQGIRRSAEVEEEEKKKRRHGKYPKRTRHPTNHERPNCERDSSMSVTSVVSQTFQATRRTLEALERERQKSKVLEKQKASLSTVI